MGLKNRPAPATFAGGRLSSVAELIRERLAAEETLRELCADHRLALTTLVRLRQERPKDRNKIKEYAALVADLEDEVIGYLLDPARSKPT